MKQSLSIKSRVTLFYSLVFVLLTAAVAGALVYTAEAQVQSVSTDTLEAAVKDATRDISHYDGRVEVDPDFDFYVHGVSLMLYGPKGTALLGAPPVGFPASTPLVSDEHRTITGEAENWLVYDLYLPHPDSSGIWIRGVYSLSNSASAFHAVSRGILIAFPAFSLLVVAVGYLITKRAFRPVAAIRDAAQEICSGNDLTRRIALPEAQDELYDLTVALNGMMDRLSAAFENERQFTSDVSHELKTPLSVILSQCEDCLGEARSLADCRAGLTSIQEQSRRMAALIGQLLELSRNFSARASLHLEPVSLDLLIESIAEELTPAAEAKGIRIIQKLEADVSGRFDQTMLMRLVINLISNGIRYGKPGGFVLIGLVKRNGAAVLTVADNGIGIAPEHLPKIFNRFYQAENARSHTSSGGFGLGLSFVKWIAEAHGGTVAVESTASVGTEFTVSLPLVP